MRSQTTELAHATRTQIYLSAEQRRALDARAQEERKTLAHVIRDAVDRYLAEEMDAGERDWVLAQTFGTCLDLGKRVPSRDEWDRNPVRDYQAGGRGGGGRYPHGPLITAVRHVHEPEEAGDLATTQAAAAPLGDVQARTDSAHTEAVVRLTMSQVDRLAMLPAWMRSRTTLNAAGRHPAAPPRQIMIADWRSAGADDLVCDLAVPLSPRDVS